MANKDGVAIRVKKVLAYKYNAWKPGIKDAIIQQTLNSSGVRDIGRNLKINKNTVVAVLKKNSQRQPLLFNKR